eukprot:PLAT12456.9.p1 GENE.PLAT12456.9~~PLAT12456.9.p1  ORF type:complete len:436 (-),score=195.40 PLAT12456.9:75-1349(-)
MAASTDKAGAPAGAKAGSSILTAVMKPQLLAVYVNVALYAMCFQMQQPLMPFLIKSLGGGSDSFGNFSFAFSLAQLAGGLISGPLIDRYGAKVVMLLSFGSSALCYALTASATTMTMLYISRLPTVFQHAVLGARAIISRHGSDEHRSTLLAYVGVAYGVGFAIGPAMGGRIGEAYSLQTGAWLATGGSLISCVIIAAVGAGTAVAPSDGKGSDDASSSSSSRSGGSSLLNIALRPRVRGMLSLKLLVGLGLALFYSTFPLIMTEHLGLGKAQLGDVMTYIGVLSIIVQGVLVKAVSDRFSDSAIMRSSLLTLGLSLLALGWVRTVTHVLIVIVPIAISSSLANTAMTSVLVGTVPKKESGSVLALDMGFGSGVRMITGKVGALLLSSMGVLAIGGGGGALTLLGVLLLQGGFLSATESDVKKE